MMHAMVGVVVRTVRGDRDEQAAAILCSIVVRAKTWEGGWQPPPGTLMGLTQDPVLRPHTPIYDYT